MQPVVQPWYTNPVGTTGCIMYTFNQPGCNTGCTTRLYNVNGALGLNENNLALELIMRLSYSVCIGPFIWSQMNASA
jgi:hypothetical protein